jgi:hypothetical protein
MPWEIREEANEFCVYKKNGEKVQCHQLREHAEQQMSALYANEKAVMLCEDCAGRFDGDPETLALEGGDPKTCALCGEKGKTLRPYEASKAGRRMSGTNVEKLTALSQQLRTALGTLGDLLAWSQYADASPIISETLSLDSVDGLLASLKGIDAPPMHLREVKSTASGTVIGGIMAPWGNPQNRDLHLDYFTPDTEFYLDNYAKAPAMFQHGKDSMIGKARLGHRDDAYKTDNGLWVQDWISKSNRFWGVIEALLQANKLYYSPGSVPHLVDRTPERKLKAYPIVDDTFTPTPAQYQLGLRKMSLDYVKSLYDDAGLQFDVPEPLREKVTTTLTSDRDREAQKAEALARLTIAKAKMLSLEV